MVFNLFFPTPRICSLFQEPLIEISKLDETLSSSGDFHAVERVTARAPRKFIDAPRGGMKHWVKNIGGGTGGPLLFLRGLALPLLNFEFCLNGFK